MLRDPRTLVSLALLLSIAFLIAVVITGCSPGRFNMEAVKIEQETYPNQPTEKANGKKTENDQTGQ